MSNLPLNISVCGIYPVNTNIPKVPNSSSAKCSESSPVLVFSNTTDSTIPSPLISFITESHLKSILGFANALS